MHKTISRRKMPHSTTQITPSIYLHMKELIRVANQYCANVMHHCGQESNARVEADALQKCICSWRQFNKKLKPHMTVQDWFDCARDCRIGWFMIGRPGDNFKEMRSIRHFYQGGFERETKKYTYASALTIYEDVRAHLEMIANLEHKKDLSFWITYDRIIDQCRSNAVN
tara:strand:+ start:63 stop:569 length:507 start_codon:yes stop_codon:yes gene_type:complete